MTFKQFIDGIPKTELHLHLDGAFTLEFLFELVKKYNIDSNTVKTGLEVLGTIGTGQVQAGTCYCLLSQWQSFGSGLQDPETERIRKCA